MNFEKIQEKFKDIKGVAWNHTSKKKKTTNNGPLSWCVLFMCVQTHDFWSIPYANKMVISQTVNGCPPENLIWLREMTLFTTLRNIISVGRYYLYFYIYILTVHSNAIH
jgi:hypothetical protein